MKLTLRPTRVAADVRLGLIRRGAAIHRGQLPGPPAGLLRPFWM